MGFILIIPPVQRAIRAAVPRPGSRPRAALGMVHPPNGIPHPPAHRAPVHSLVFLYPSHSNCSLHLFYTVLKSTDTHLFWLRKNKKQIYVI